MKIKADLTLLNLFQLDDLKGSSERRSRTSHEHCSFIIQLTVSSTVFPLINDVLFLSCFLKKTNKKQLTAEIQQEHAVEDLFA